jgi:hypothetical protein
MPLSEAVQNTIADRIEVIRDYPKLVIARPAVVSKITNSEPVA